MSERDQKIEELISKGIIKTKDIICLRFNQKVLDFLEEEGIDYKLKRIIYTPGDN